MRMGVPSDLQSARPPTVKSHKEPPRCADDNLSFLEQQYKEWLDFDPSFPLHEEIELHRDRMWRREEDRRVESAVST